MGLRMILSWLSKAESLVSKMEVLSIVFREIKKQEKELQSLRNDVNKHASEYDSNYSGGDSFQAACDVGNCRDLMSVCGGRTLGFWPSLENWRHTNAFFKLSEILLCCHFLDQNSTFFCSSVLFSRTIKRVSPYFITTNISQRDLSKNWDHKASFNWSWQKIMIMIVIMTDMPIFW